MDDATEDAVTEEPEPPPTIVEEPVELPTTELDVPVAVED
jgi:hypothetical protein